MAQMTDIERQSMEVDIVCVGFGPATGGFLSTLSRAMQDPDLAPALQETPPRVQERRAFCGLRRARFVEHCSHRSGALVEKNAHER